MGPVEPARNISVEVDAAALAAEAASIAAAAPAAENSTPQNGAEADASAGTTPALAEPAPPMDHNARAAEVEPAMVMLVEQAANFIAPNWKVTHTEATGVGKALALVASYWLPDESIPPKYLALVTLAGSLWSVASTRRDESGAFKPLRISKAPAPIATPPVEQPRDPTLSL